MHRAVGLTKCMAPASVVQSCPADKSYSAQFSPWLSHTFRNRPQPENPTMASRSAMAPIANAVEKYRSHCGRRNIMWSIACSEAPRQQSEEYEVVCALKHNGSRAREKELKETSPRLSLEILKGCTHFGIRNPKSEAMKSET